MAIPDQSFAPPQSQLGATPVLGGIPVASAPSGGQGLALDPLGRIPFSNEFTAASQLPRAPQPGEIRKLTDTTGGGSLVVGWDSNAGKWISEKYTSCTQGSSAGAGSTINVVTRGELFSWKVWDTIGLDLEVRLQIQANGGSGSTQEYYALASTADLPNALTDDTTNLTGAVNVTGTSNVTLDSGWTALNTSVAVTDLLALNIGSARTAGVNNGNLRANSALWYRWVYTPATS